MSLGIAAAAFLAAAPPAGGPQPVPLAPPPVSSAVTSYPPGFFAAAQPTTALDMVSLLPGFTFDKGDTVRGFGGAAGNVLIDGARPASKDDSLDQILKRIPVSSVLRIDVIRGGAPGIDMQGKTVLANVVRRSDAGAKLTLAASVTHAPDGRIGGSLRAEASKRAGATTLEGSLLFGRGFDDGAGNGPRIRTDAAGATLFTAQEHSLGAVYNYKATAAIETPVLGGKLRVNGSVFLSPYDYTQFDLHLDSPVREFERYHEDPQTAEIGLRYDHALGPHARIETFLLQQLGRKPISDDYATDGFAADFALRKTTSESIARATVTYDVTKALSVQTGAEGDFNWLQTHTTYAENGVPIALPAANVRVTEARGEAFAIATWQARPTLTVEAGMRAEASRIASTGDVVNTKTLFYPKPRLAVTWSPDGADQIRLRAEHEVGQLNFDDFAASAATLNTGTVHAGNPNLNPQQDWVLEAAYDRRFWSAAEATITYRHFFLADVIDRAPIFDPAGTFDAPGNIGNGTKDEVAFTLTLPTDRFAIPRGLLTGQATWRWSRVIDPTTGQPRPISGLRPLDAEAHFTQGIPRFKATWGFDIYNQWQETYYRFNEIDTDKLKTYVVLFAEYKPRPDLAFRAEIDNAGARGFEHVRNVYVDARNTSPLAFTDLRDLHFGRILYFRVLKTFG